MKIIQIINSLDTGGAEKLVYEIHRRFRKHGLDSVLISLVGEKYGWSEMGVFSLGLSSPYNPKVMFKLATLPEKVALNGADIIHTHLFPTQLFIALFYLCNLDINGKLLTTEHSTLNRRRKKKWGRPVDRWIYSKYDRIVCNSNGTASSLGTWIPDEKEKLTVIYNGANLKTFMQERQKDNDESSIILSVGRLVEAKNYETALDAFSILNESVDGKLQYIIAGSGSLKKVLINRIKELGLIKQVKLPGNVSNIPDLMQKANVFFIPSRWEGFGIAAVEAMAMGIPIVASNVQGLREIIGAEETCGILVDPDSPQEMATALERLLIDPALSSKMGKKGMERANCFDIDTTVDNYLRLYNEVLSAAD